MKPKKSTSFLQTITSKIYDPSHKWQSDLWLLKWIALLFIIIDFHWLNKHPMIKIDAITLAELLYLVYAFLFLFFYRNKLSFKVQVFNLMSDFLVFASFEALALSIFGFSSRMYVLYLIPVIYCSYWFRWAFTLIFVTLVSAAYFIINYSILLANMGKFFIFSEIKGTLAPVVISFFLISFAVLFFKRIILKYLVQIDQELETRAEKIEQEKEYTRSLLKDKIDGFIAIDEYGYITEINKLACDLFGYDEKYIYEQNVRDIYAPGEAVRMMRALRESPDGTIENFKTFVINKKDNEKIPILVSAAFLYDRNLALKARLKQGENFRSIGYFRDIRAEDMFDNIAREITSITNEKELLDRIVEIVAKTIKSETCSVITYNENKGILERMSAHGIPEELLRKERSEFYQVNESMTGKVFSSGKTVNIPNIDVVNRKPQDLAIKWQYMKQFARYSRFGDLKHFLGTPLRIQGEVYGVIRVLNKYLNDKELDERGFQDKDQILLERISSQVSVLVEKIRNKERFEAISKIGMELNDKLDLPLEDFLELVAREVVIRMGFKACLIRLVEEGNKLKIRASYGFKHNYKINGNLTLEIGEGAAGEVAKTGIDKIVPDMSKSTKTKFKEIAQKENLKSMLSTPIKYQNRGIGAINCFTRREHNFTLEEIQILHTFAVYTAVAIQNRKRVQELLALNEIGTGYLFCLFQYMIE